jgi:cytosol alanyl aminopeptidase
MWKRMLATCSVLLLACHHEPAAAPPVAPAPAPEPAIPVDPASRLPDGVQPIAYALELEIVPDNPGFAGRVRIEVELARAVDSILLHADRLELSRVAVAPPVGGTAVTAQPRSVGSSGLVSLDLSGPIGPGTANVDIEFKGSYDAHLRGLYKVQANGAAYAFTQFEAVDARQAFPCFDEPRFKTPFDITLRVPQGLTAISNTRVARQSPLASGQVEMVFNRTEKLPTYLVAFAVGPLDVVDAPPLPPNRARANPVPLRGIAPRGRGPEMAFALAETPALVESLERYFGVAYPYEKLDLIAVPDFAAGAMENAGAITFRDTLLLLNYKAPEWQRRLSVAVNAHELAHQWFGDLVTMPWWDDIWLNEGFATWLAGRVVQEVHPEYKAELARVAQLERAFDTDAKENARRVRQPIESDHDIRNAFDSITYTKGGALLAMFERYLGSEAFRTGLRRYLEQHRFATGTSEELLVALEEGSGKPVAKAFSSFLDQPGVPSISADLRCSPGTPPSVHLAQHRYVPLGSTLASGGPNAAAGTEAIHIGPGAAGAWQVPVCLRHGVAGSLPRDARPKAPPARDTNANEPGEQCILLDSPEADVTLNANECPQWLFPNARAAGYYRWSVGDAQFTALLESGFAALDPGERLSLLSNTEAGARAGQRSFEQLMSVTRKVIREPERELVQSALGVLARVREALVGDAELPAYRRLLEELILPRQKQLGLFPAAKEDGEAKLLRPALISALAFEARHASLRQELDRLGRAQLGLAEDKRLSRLPSELIESALGVAVQEGGAPVIERAIALVAGSNDGIERGRLLGALGVNLNPELTPTVLALTLSPTLRTNERLGMIFGQARQRETREAAFTWVQEHFDALVGRLGRELGTQLTAVAGTFCSREDAERARRFYSPRIDALAGGPRSLRLNLESSELCAAFAAAHRDSARKYFTSTSGS